MLAGFHNGPREGGQHQEGKSTVGAQDGDLPKIMREMADATPDSLFQIINDCGHLPSVAQPEIFFKAVDSFVRGLGIG
jgi:pimeloyl-ACP methyl ester carboxylesterase